MTWQDALEIVVAESGNQRFRELCREDNQDTEQRDAYRSLMIRRATNEPAQPAPAPTDEQIAAILGCCPGVPLPS